ncbi:MAG: cobalt transporter CbiM [Coriobacteriales bacterium]|jgi:cobalt/nickel transport system permease protein
MHIPENYLSPSTCGVFGVATVGIWAVAIRKVSRSVPKDKMPLLGVAAAFCFLAMMFNIPLPGGTTGHAVCGTLVAILFGPWASVIAVSIALIIQAVFFGDGGILAIGANCFNMAFVLPMVGYGVYRLVRGRSGGLGRELVAAGVGSYVGINCAALCAALEFGVQPLLFTDSAGAALYCPYPVSVAVPAMMVGHLTVAGIAETVFTVGILAFVRKVAPNFALLPGSSAPAAGGAASGAEAPSLAASVAPVAVLVGLLIVATPLGLLAEGDAWGEWGIEDLANSLGYTPSGMASGWEWTALMPDYSIGSLPDWVGYVLSAVIGVALLVIVFRLVAAAMKTPVDFDARQA